MKYTEEDIQKALTGADLMSETEFLRGDRVKALASALRDAQERMNRTYSERCALAIGFAQLAAAIGIKAGWYKDPTHEDWDDAWRIVVLVQGDLQVSWHMDPEHSIMAQKLLPEIEPCWDGTSYGKKPDWPVHVCFPLLPDPPKE